MTHPAVKIRDFVALLPPHKFSLTICHNPHRDYYESVADLLRTREAHDENIIDRESLVKGDELWELTVFPNSPGGSYTIFGPTLESVLLKALEE